MTNPKKQPFMPYAFATVVVLTALTAGALAIYGTGEEGIRHVNRYFARFSFAIFMTIFMLPALLRASPGGLPRTLHINRRNLGLSFALAFSGHLVAIIVFFQMLPEQELDWITLIGGGFGFVCTGAMALTSNDWAVHRLGPTAWSRLHGFGLYYLWVIFAYTFVERAALQSPRFVPLAIVAFLGLGLRLYGKHAARHED